MSRLVTNAIRSTAASSDAMTIDSAGKPAFPNGGVGKILQVVQNVKTGVTSMSSQQSETAIAGTDQNGSGSIFCIKITPSSTSSKILFKVVLNHGTTNDQLSGGIIYRDSTALGLATSVGSRKAVTFPFPYIPDGDGSNPIINCVSYEYLDSPNSTSELTYSVKYYNHHSDTSYINRSIRDSAATTYDIRTSSTLTAYEVAA
tara:strand:- start:1868 stop:2473 length:606 start_codon:yes stop_codon:yes gene_type:complete